MTLDRLAIASRIRGLCAGQDAADPLLAANRLGINERLLRVSIDELAPEPSVEVIAAIVHAFGVDPTWLLTGDYDPALHRNILDGEVGVGQVVARILGAGPATDPATRFPGFA
jgi:hypothetical protein